MSGDSATTTSWPHDLRIDGSARYDHHQRPRRWLTSSPSIRSGRNGCGTEAREYGKAAIGYDDLEHLPLLDRVFREALRINPPVGLIMREAVKDTDILGQYVPAGTKLMVALIGTHRLPECASNPEELDPDRFAPHRREDRAHPFLWSPFGGGVHKCIGLYFGGLQAKTILYQLLRTYRWSS